jgi:hypothetical protein
MSRLKAGDLAYYTGTQGLSNEQQLGHGVTGCIVRLVAFVPAGSLVPVNGQLFKVPHDGWSFQVPGKKQLHGADVNFFLPLERKPGEALNS